MPLDLTPLGRGLRFPNRHPLSSTSTVDDDSLQNPQLSWLTDDPAQRVNVVLNLSLDEFVAIASAIDAGRDIAYGEASEAIWWLWTRAFAVGSQATGEQQIESDPPVFAYGGYQAICDVFDDIDSDDCEDDMACLKPVKMNGKWYLPVDCGCADSIFIPLSDAVSVDANGDPIAVDDGGSVDFGFSVGSGNLSCYQADATDYLLDRAIAFAHAVIDFTANVLDWATPLDETVESVALASDIFFGTGDLPEIGTLTKDAVTAAMKNTAVGTPLAAAWNFTGNVTKANLRTWVQNAPYLQGVIPVRLILDNWIDGSLLLGLNNGLKLIAASCESGTIIPDGFPSVETLLASGFAWAKTFDLTTAPFIENANFAIGEASGVDAAVWTDGVGYESVPDLYANPHVTSKLLLNFTGNTGGNVHYWAVRYRFEPEPTANNDLREHKIAASDYDISADFDGVHVSPDPFSSAGNINIEFWVDRQLNVATTVGGYAVITAIAFAGTGVEEYTLLAQA